MKTFLLAAITTFFLCLSAFGDTPPARAVNANLYDVNDNGLTSQASGGQRALDVGINVSGIPVDPRARTWTLSNSTDSCAAVQSGTWNLNNISGTISLPTGAATAANQSTINTTLTGIDTHLQATQPRKMQDGSGNNLTSSLVNSRQALDVHQADTSFVVSGLSAVGAAPTLNPLSMAGVDTAGLKRHVLVDTQGRMVIAPSPYAAVKVHSTVTLATGTSLYYDYTVPSSNTLLATLFYAGGQGTGSAELISHVASATALLTNGSFENSTEVSAWAANTGNFTAPTPDSNSTQFTLGAASMRWTYSASVTALKRKQTFGTPQDFSGYRYLKFSFFNDANTGVNRTIGFILTSSSGATATYTVTLVAGTTLPSNAWYSFQADMAFPTSSTGSGFDLTQITSIDLSMQDSANKSGTVYWDGVQFADSINRLHKVYFPASGTSALHIDEKIPGNTSLYLLITNTSNGANEYTAVLSGNLQ